MKSVDKGKPVKRAARASIIRREAAHLTADLSRTANGQKLSQTESANRPERDAAESVKDGVADAAFAVGELSANAARAAYLRGKAAREKILRAKGTRRAGSTGNTLPILPDMREKSPAAPRVEIPTGAQRKERVRRQLFAQRAAAKQAEKEALYGTAGAVQNEPSLRLVHWRQDTKRRIFRESALWQSQTRRTGAVGRMRPASPLPRPMPRLRGVPAMRVRLQSTAGRVLGRLASALVKTARAAVQSIAALVGAGGIVLLLVMVAGAAAAIIGSPMGILLAGETGDPNAVSVADIVRETNAAFGQAINDIVAAHPECDEVDIQYHYEAGRTWTSYWPEVLAVFAVQANLGDGDNVAVIDAANARRVQNTFWEMHEIAAEVETVEIESDEDEAEETGETDEGGDGENAAPAPQYRYILHISVSGKTADEMADRCHFTADQRDILHQLLSAEMRPALLALCGGATGGIPAGALQWPLPGYTTISCGFGEPDAIRGLPHKGIDIPAPEGTPILAAHDGTVLVSGWNDSYGNQVLLDNGAGLSTRYAHMTETAVSAGETVAAGQVIGYVGSTGDSTGNHLHFEVMMNGVRIEPMAAFT